MREERLRATAGVRGNVNLSSWRGRSGRRYVVGVHPLSEAEVLEITDAVIVAVGRDGDGVARVVDVAAAGSEVREAARRTWIAKVIGRGATEMHVHRLAEDDAERREIMADLRDEDDDRRPVPGALALQREH